VKAHSIGAPSGLTGKETVMFKISVAVVLAVTLLTSWAVAEEAVKLSDDGLVIQGDKQWANGRLDDARKSFEQAVAANPGSVAARMKLGGFQLASRSYSPAIETYQKTISLDATNAKAWIGLGMAYLHTGQQDLSRAAFAEAIRVEPARKAQLAQLAEKSAK
jgi:tetratricopeptide (TPR) repeat protein